MKKLLLGAFVSAAFLGCATTGVDKAVLEAAMAPGPINWNNWYVSVPLENAEGNGKATSIFTEDIVNNNFTDEQKKYFMTNEDGSYTLFTHFTGYTTSGQYDFRKSGKYCRTELREFYRGNQDTNDNWSMDEGLHQMESTLKVEYLPEKVKGTYVAQIHGISDEYTKENTVRTGNPATVKVLYQPGGDLLIEYYRAPAENPDEKEWTSSAHEKIQIGNVGNEVFTIKLKVENGVLYYGLTCEAKGIDVGYKKLYNYAKNGYNYRNYFKTGNYFGYNVDGEKYSQVVLFDVKTFHSNN
ncbi:MAG: polysaccharide lyase family 7 protein [Spirochaetales bacterium]|nr:polysaccharide lyase family 7 protein [Spirochaetales bacterium]